MSFFANKSVKHQINVFTEKFVATEGQTIFTLSNTYELGSSRLKVFVEGVQQFSPTNYTETSNKSITLSQGVVIGTEIIVEVTQIK